MDYRQTGMVSKEIVNKNRVELQRKLRAAQARRAISVISRREKKCS